MESAWGFTWQAAAERAKQVAASVSESSQKMVSGQSSPQAPDSTQESTQSSSWDWFSAAQKAKEIAAQISETTATKAKEISTQLSESSKVLVDKARPITEQATQKLKEFKINESIATIEERLNEINTKIDSEGQQEVITEEELAAFGMTSDYLAFVRSLNYSTFRDFPADHLRTLDNEGEGPEEGEDSPTSDSSKPPLTPWQVRHATLLVRTVKEINELRYVLCPRRMNDDQFWAIYFNLARKQLPRKAYDHSTPVPTFASPKSPPQPKALSDVMRSTFKNMNLSALTKPSGFGFNLSDWSSSGGKDDTQHDVPPHQNRTADGEAVALHALDGPGAEEAATEEQSTNDPDWEEYLKVASGSGQPSESGDQDQEIADVDLESYINELNAVSGGDGNEEDGENDGDGSDDGNDADLGELLAAMSDENGEGGDSGVEVEADVEGAGKAEGEGEDKSAATSEGELVEMGDVASNEDATEADPDQGKQ